MVNLRVRELANEKGITTIKELAGRAGLAYDTAADLWHGRMQRIDRDVLARVCKALGVLPGDLLVFEDTEEMLSPMLAAA